MESFIHSLVPFLAILNPFALCLYLAGVMEDLRRGEFIRVLAGACITSLLVFWVFSMVGQKVLTNWLGVHPEALRIFGGVIFFVVAYSYVTKGYRAAAMLRGSLDDLPAAIALPFMIGAGTITQSIVVGKTHGPMMALLIITAAVSACFAIVLAFKLIHDRTRGARERIFERYVNILARVNGLLIGAISTDMVVTGLKGLWWNGGPSGL